jgi:hypothetical protein
VKIILSILFIFLSLSYDVLSSSPDLILVSSSGNCFNSGNYSLSWSLGEPIIQTLESNGYFLTQGFQQSQYQVTFVIDNYTDSIECTPIPADEILNIKINSLDYSNQITLELISLPGIVCKSITSYDKNIQMNVSDLQSGIYFLKISCHNRPSIYKKIIKI